MRKQYTSSELDFLKLNYETKGPGFCSEQIGKSYGGIQKAAKRLGLKANHTLICNTSEKVKVARIRQGEYLSSNYNNPSIEGKNTQNIKDLYIAGLSCNQIADIYECSKGPILAILKDMPKRKTTDYAHHQFNKDQTGDKNHAWQGGIKSVYDRFRDLQKYFDWRKAVLSRGNNKCIGCNSTDDLQAHHSITLKTLIRTYCSTNFKDISELTHDDLMNDFFYDTNNGITYCEDCHKEFHKLNGRN